MKKALEYIMGKGENAGNKHLFSFFTVFPTLPKTIPINRTQFY